MEALEGLVRNEDPDTSYEAAEKIKPRLREIQLRVMGLLAFHGPLTDEELLNHYIASYGPTAESTPRKRRCELAEFGIVRWNGEKRETKAECSSRVWELAPEAEWHEPADDEQE